MGISLMLWITFARDATMPTASLAQILTPAPFATLLTSSLAEIVWLVPTDNTMIPQALIATIAPVTAISVLVITTVLSALQALMFTQQFMRTPENVFAESVKINSTSIP
jgi:hypothetical protein